MFQITELIAHLERVHRRPGMYIGPVSHATMESYLEGLYTGLRLCGVEPDVSAYRQITRERGWNDATALGAYPDMQRKGLSEQEIALEELLIHIELWRRLAENNPPPA